MDSGKKYAVDSQELFLTTEPAEFSFKGHKAFAVCMRVYDGDTIWIKLKLGDPWGVVKLRCRMYGYDCSEVRGGAEGTKEQTKLLGKMAKNFLSNLILNKLIFVVFGDNDMYGRPLIDVYNVSSTTTGMCSIDDESVNHSMVINGHGILYQGFGEKKNKLDVMYLSTLTDDDGINEIVEKFIKLNSGVIMPTIDVESKWLYQPNRRLDSPSCSDENNTNEIKQSSI